MEKEKSAFDCMPDWFQEKTRAQVKKELEDAAKHKTVDKEAIKSNMEKAIKDLIPE